MSESYIDIEKIDCLLNKLKAISNPDRIAILELLQRKEKASSSEIQAMLNIDSTLSSYHLKILRDQHFVIAKSAGQSKYYSINHIALDDIITSISTCS